MRASLEEQEGAAEVLDSAELEKREIQDLLSKPYKFGFVSDIESEQIPKGLSEETVRRISAKKKVSRRDAPSWPGARDTGARERPDPTLPSSSTQAIELRVGLQLYSIDCAHGIVS